MQMKHIPLRTCIVTNEKKDKRDLVRFVIDPKSGKLVIDKNEKIRARGAYIVPDLDMYDIAISKGVLSSALGIEIDKKNAENAKNELIVYISRLKLQKEGKNVKVRVKGTNIKLD